MTEEQKAELASEIVDGRIYCSKAFEVAEKLGVSPAEVGVYLDEIGVKVQGCQLGCF